MFVLKVFQNKGFNMFQSFSSQSILIHQTKTFSSNIKQIDNDAPVEMENPYKTPLNRCLLCGVHVDYKNVQLLSQFVSSFTGLTIPEKATPLCEKKYKEVNEAINMSQKSGFMPVESKESVFLTDPTFHTLDMKKSRRGGN